MKQDNENLINPSDTAFQLAANLKKLMSESVNDRIGNIPDQILQITHQLNQIQTRQQQFAYNFESIGDYLKKNSSNSKLLENAVTASQVLTDEHYQKHIIEPMAYSLFAVIDIIEDSRRSSSNVTNCDLLDAIKSQLLQFFVGYDIKIIQHKKDSNFDPKLMKPVNIVPTEDKKLDGYVAISLQPGFCWKNKLLRAESVSLYKYETVNVNLIEEGE